MKVGRERSANTGYVAISYVITMGNYCSVLFCLFECCLGDINWMALLAFFSYMEEEKLFYLLNKKVSERVCSKK